MRILIFCGGAFYSGLEIQTLKIIDLLLANNHKVKIITSFWNTGDFKKQLLSRNIDFEELKLGFFYAKKPKWTFDFLRYYPQSILKLLEIKKTYAPELIYHTSHRTVITATPFFSSIKTIYHLHQTFSVNKLDLFFFNLLKKNITKYIAVSENVKRSLISNGIEKSSIEIVYNWIDHIEYNFSQKTDAIVNIGIVGQVLQHKGHEILFKALNILHKQNIYFKLSIFGEGDHDFKKNLISLADNAGWLKQLKFLGFLDKKEEIYAGMHVLVAPSLESEAFGLIAIEAGLFKVPVICSNLGGLKEIITHNENGLLFETGNENDLSQKIKTLIENPLLAEKLAENNFRNVIQRFANKPKEVFINLIKTI